MTFEIVHNSFGNSYDSERRNEMAAIRYFKLFDMLARKGKKKTDLIHEIGLSSSTVTKLAKGETVTTETILRICEEYNVQPGDIMEYIPE